MERPHSIHKYPVKKRNRSLNTVVPEIVPKARRASFTFKPKKHLTPDDLISLVDQKAKKTSYTWGS